MADSLDTPLEELDEFGEEDESTDPGLGPLIILPEPEEEPPRPIAPYVNKCPACGRKEDIEIIFNTVKCMNPNCLFYRFK